MTGGHDTNLERLSDLLADRATQALSAEESAELISLLASSPDVDEHALDRAAAAVDLSSIPSVYEPLPRSVRARVDQSAIAWLAGRKGMHLVGEDLAGPGADTSGSTTASRTPRGARSWMPWLVAAACLAIAVISWWPPRGPASLSTQRAALVSESGTLTIPWTQPGVSGDVVWNGRQQAGFLRISGLAANDPTDFQYQLWIFDTARSDYSDNVAVDGGVFDIDQATGDVIVPIRSKLSVAKPFLFAVTTEPPGGVVKHNPDREPDRYRIVLTAPVA